MNMNNVIIEAIDARISFVENSYTLAIVLNSTDLRESKMGMLIRRSITAFDRFESFHS